MDKLNVFAKSSYQRNFYLASLVIFYQVICNKKQKSIKPLNGKVGQTDVTKISSSFTILDSVTLLSHFEIYR